MLEINGVGAVKLERFAQDFIQMILEHKKFNQKNEELFKLK